MPATERVAYTCDVCGVSLSVNAVIRYSLCCVQPGHGVTSLAAEPIYACNSQHALQALTAQFAALEERRKVLVEQAFIQGQ